MRSVRGAHVRHPGFRLNISAQVLCVSWCPRNFFELHQLWCVV